MGLYWGNLYWDKTRERESIFESLNRDIKSKVLIVGGGMSGNLCANKLAKAGLSVTVIEKNKLGKGSSAANTGLLQYTSDKMMSDLAKDIGEDKAYLFYKMCLQAMDDLSLLNKELEGERDYRNRNSIYYSSSKKDKRKIKREYKMLERYNFPVEYIDESRLSNTYKINKPNAIKTWHDADVNPYKFILSLVEENLKNGVEYYENTNLNLENIEENKIQTIDGKQIEFEHIVLATGYSHIYPIIKDKYEMYRTYAFCSKKMDGFLWKEDSMIWETKNPYLYFRATKDKRIIAGGLDIKSDRLEKNQDKIDRKNNKIAEQVESIYPHLNIELEYSWNALFGASKDGIPFIGRDPVYSNRFYLLGYEGNGTAYSMAGSKIILDLIRGEENPYADIVRVDR